MLILNQERTIRDYTYKQLEKEDGYTVSQLLQNVNNMLASYELIAETTFSNGSLLDKMPIGSDTFFEAYDIYLDRFRPYIDGLMSTINISRVTVYTNLTTFPFADIQPIDQAVQKEKWYQESAEGGKSFSKTWSVMGESPLSHRRYFRLTSRSYDAKTKAEVLICFDMDDRLLTDLISKQDQDHRYILKLNNDDVLLDSNDQRRQGQKIASYDPEIQQMLSAVTPQLEPSSVIVGDREQYMLTTASLHDRKSVEGLTMYSFSPLDELNSRLRQERIQSFTLFVIAIVASGLLIYLFSLGVTNRLYILVKRMRNININNLNQSVEVKGNDEIAQLGNVFNSMTRRVDKLIAEVVDTKLASKELEIKMKESELYALQTQINPHYLFNTLNAIYGSALENGDRETARIVKLLASSFRNILQRGGNSIQLKEELDIVQTYLDIQVFRFIDKLHYEFDVPEEFLLCEIPRLSLQTLIENAVIHGVEKSDKPVSISVWCEDIDHTSFALHVTDDGPGISNERLGEVREWLSKGVPMNGISRIGLLNIHQRLQHMFGSQYGIQLTSIPHTETTISLILPYSKGTGKD